MRLKKRKYYFSDSSISSDTIISYVMGAIALIVEITAIIFSIATGGSMPKIFGPLTLCAIILGISGEIFAWIGNASLIGGVVGKRISIILNIVAVLLPVVIMIF